MLKSMLVNKNVETSFLIGSSLQPANQKPSLEITTLVHHLLSIAFPLFLTSSQLWRMIRMAKASLFHKATGYPILRTARLKASITCHKQMNIPNQYTVPFRRVHFLQNRILSGMYLSKFHKLWNTLICRFACKGQSQSDKNLAKILMKFLLVSLLGVMSDRGEGHTSHEEKCVCGRDICVESVISTSTAMYCHRGWTVGCLFYCGLKWWHENENSVYKQGRL